MTAVNRLRLGLGILGLALGIFYGGRELFADAPIVYNEHLIQVTYDPSSVGRSGSIGAVAVHGATGEMWIKTSSSRTDWTPVGGAGGGYRGDWATGTYNAGDIVTDGPFSFGATATTSTRPVIDDGDVSSSSSWFVLGSASQTTSTHIGTLVDGPSAQGALISKTAHTESYVGRRFIVDAQLSPDGGADGLTIGFYNGSATTSPTLGAGLDNVTGFYGIEIDIYNNQFRMIVNGNGASSPTTQNTCYIATANGPGNGGIESGNTTFSRYYLDVTSNAGTLTFKLWRDAYKGNPDSCEAGRVATFTGITDPGFSSWRFAVSARSGGVSGTFRIKDHAYSMHVPGVQTNGWTYLGAYPHSPNISSTAFKP